MVFDKHQIGVVGGIEVGFAQELIPRGVVDPLSQTLQGHAAVGGMELVGEQLGAGAEEGQVPRGQDADLAHPLAACTRVEVRVMAPVFEACDVAVDLIVGLRLTCMRRRGRSY